MISSLLVGTLLGISAGYVPGPLLTLVITETLRYGIMQGIKVALAPLITDFPIICISLLMLIKLSNFDFILAGITFLGAGFVTYLGFETLRAKTIQVDLNAVKAHSFAKGIVTNALNPHPYLFWISVGSPMILKTVDTSLAAAVIFIGSFYMFLVGSKVVLAVVVGFSSSFLSAKFYAVTLKILGILLIVFALFLFYDALSQLGIIHG